MRPLLPIGCLLLISLSACEPQAQAPQNAGDMAEMMMMHEYEEMYDIPQHDMPLVHNDQPRNTNEPLSMELIDDSPNPVLSQHLLTPEEIEAGWIALFDGETLFGWSSNNADVKWRVDEGVITADEGGSGLLLTDVPFSDFELICEYRISKGGNSGIFLRSTRNPQDLQRDCLELNIAEEHPEDYLTGSLVGRQKGEIVLPQSDEWRHVQVRVIRNRVLVDIDSKQMLDYIDERPDWKPAGLIGLQQRIGHVEFRKVNLRPLTLSNMFNGSTLEGWQQVPGSKAAFTVTEEMLHVEGGAGFLESLTDYQDFLFQAQARTEAGDVNTGIFFRAEPGTAEAPSNGYEMQINNGFAGNDRNRPTNSGSGAIFRRVDARRVVGSDYDWMTLTLLACGPRVATWVNGYQVVNWVDTREANDNPRRGLRLQGGRLSLQGHDPGTKASFRYLRIQELPTCEAESTPSAKQ